LVDEELLTVTDAGPMQQDCLAELITLLDKAMILEKGESAVIDFAVLLFKVLGYSHRERWACMRFNTAFSICGKMRHTTASVCIVGQNDSILRLVQMKRKNMESVNSPAQLVAKAIAASSQNNRHRKAARLPLGRKGESFS
jgi:hypothetical protein